MLIAIRTGKRQDEVHYKGKAQENQHLPEVDHLDRARGGRGFERGAGQHEQGGAYQEEQLAETRRRPNQSRDKLTRTRPNSISSPGVTTACCSMLRPLIRVPFVEPRSSSHHRLSLSVNEAWREET